VRTLKRSANKFAHNIYVRPLMWVLLFVILCGRS
jgi:hypothetical protein